MGRTQSAFIDPYDMESRPLLVQTAVVMAARGSGAAPSQVSAAADFMGPGVILVPKYQPTIADKVRRSYPIANRITKLPATGHPSRFFEQLAIAQGSFTNPRQITAQRVAPSRAERFVPLKAITAQVTEGLFDQMAAQRQGGQWQQLQAKDLDDAVSGCLLTHAYAIWNGTDTSLALPTTIQYVGFLTQITRTWSVGVGVSIFDSIKTEVASMVSQQGFAVRPTAIYASPVLLDLLDQEMKTFYRAELPQVELTAGVIVKAISTQAGVLPLIPDPALEASVVGVNTHYPCVIASEDMMEYHHLGDTPEPMVFELGLIANLANQRVIVMFGAPVAKGPGYAHSVGTIIR